MSGRAFAVVVGLVLCAVAKSYGGQPEMAVPQTAAVTEGDVVVKDFAFRDGRSSRSCGCITGRWGSRSAMRRGMLLTR